MTLYARIENDKVAEIFSTEGNIEEMFPESFLWINVSSEKNQPEYGWSYKDGIFIAPVVDYVDIAEREKKYRINIATDFISIWQTKLILGRLDDIEKAKLNAWLDYIDSTNAVDTSQAPNIVWPEAPAV